MKGDTHSVTTRMLRAHALAELLGTTTGTLANWRSEGRGPRYIKCGATVLYREADVEAFLAAHAVETVDSLAIA